MKIFTRLILLLSLACIVNSGIAQEQSRPRRVQPSPDAYTTTITQEPRKVVTFRTTYDGDTLASIARRLEIPVADLLKVNSFDADEPLSTNEQINIPFTASYIERARQRYEVEESDLQNRSVGKGQRARRKPAAKATRRSAPTSEERGSDYYTNVDGKRVHRPTFSRSIPDGATAQCRDGSYSFSQHRRGTCSHHGGVARWL